MWFVAGILLGVVILATIIGLHTGPHTHLAAGVLGVLTAAWLVLMVVDGTTRAPLLFSLLAADVVVSGGVGIAAWRGLASRATHTSARPGHSIEGAMGTAVGALSPNGIVRVRGENWSATSLNGHIPAGGEVQVVNIEGIRLQVWGEGAIHGATAAGATSISAASTDSPSDTDRSSSESGTGGFVQ
jgi:membrane-bound ClpP family serine protease